MKKAAMLFRDLYLGCHSRRLLNGDSFGEFCYALANLNNV